VWELSFVFLLSVVFLEQAHAEICTPKFTGYKNPPDGSTILVYSIEDERHEQFTTIEAANSSQLAREFKELILNGACQAQPSPCTVSDMSNGLDFLYKVNNADHYITDVQASNADDLTQKMTELVQAGLCSSYTGP
jgi:hypothetical protein